MPKSAENVFEKCKDAVWMLPWTLFILSECRRAENWKYIVANKRLGFTLFQLQRQQQQHHLQQQAFIDIIRKIQFLAENWVAQW